MSQLPADFSQHLLKGRIFGRGLNADTLVLVPASMVNAASILLLPSQSYELMAMNYRKNLLNDAQVSGFAKINDNQEIELNIINKTEESFVGSLFEAWVCRELMENPSAGLTAFRWATKKPGLRSGTYSRFVPFVTASTTLKNEPFTAQFYNTADNSDIRFYSLESGNDQGKFKPGLALVENTTIPAGIQVKAIRKNLPNQIINPLIENFYQNVLTILPTEEGQLSVIACRNYILTLVRNGEIDPKIGFQLMNRVKGLDEIGLSQNRANEYANFARQVYAMHKKDGFDRVWLNIDKVPFDIVNSVLSAVAVKINPAEKTEILPGSKVIEVEQVCYLDKWGKLKVGEQANQKR